MPTVEVIFFQEAEGKTPPLIEWLDELPKKARLKCLVHLKRLEDLGHELRRPEADYLRDDIHELRASYQGVHYRMLYFFHGRSVVVLTHGVVKERECLWRKSTGRSERRTRLYEIQAPTRLCRRGSNGEEKTIQIQGAPICL